MDQTLDILLAFDSFKGSMTALHACQAAERALKSVSSLLNNNGVTLQCHLLPMADGGEGTTDAFLSACGGHKVFVPVTGPYGQPVTAFYGVLPDQTVVLEMASASGITLEGNLHQPLKSTSLGTGELIHHALNAGYKDFIIGLGGSATNDGGMGMAHGLGARFIDLRGKVLEPLSMNLPLISEIDLSGMNPHIKNARFTAACDVQNPLLGPDGASRVFGPQKGATEEDILFLDMGLTHYAKILQTTFTKDFNCTGAGAAGGLGASAMAFLQAQYASGIDLLMAKSKFDDRLLGTDYLLTGEGCLDRQSLMGKVLTGLLAKTMPLQIPLVCFAGKLLLTPKELSLAGITDAKCIKPAHQSYTDAINSAENNLYEAVYSWAMGLVK